MADSEGSATSDLVERITGVIAAANRRDADAMASFYGAEIVFDMSPAGLGIFEGRDTVRGVNEDWLGAYDEFTIKPEEILDLGNGVG